MAPIVAVGPGVYRIPTAGDWVNTIVFEEPDGSITLVDAGLKRAPARIVAGLAAIGKHPGDVQRIVLTHAHVDHAGGAARLVADTAAAGVEAHVADAGYLESGTPPPSDNSMLMGRIHQRLPGLGFDPVGVVRRLVDGELMDVAGGLRVHHTPGHTPGHISLLHEPSRVLITGDAIFNMRLRLTWPVPFACTSAALNRRSAHVLAELDYDVAAFTHGPHISDGAREAVRGFLRRKGA